MKKQSYWSYLLYNKIWIVAIFVLIIILFILYFVRFPDEDTQSAIRFAFGMIAFVIAAVCIGNYVTWRKNR